jgi:proteasome lid subunit RPN8/RPN11
VKEIVSKIELLATSLEEEQCGIILKDGSVLPSKNLHEHPEDAFRIDPALLLKYEDDLYGSWHSHPKGKANLSQADYLSFLRWPNLKHYIQGVDGTRCFVVENGLVVEIDLD